MDFAAQSCEEFVARNQIKMEPIASKKKIPPQKLVIPDSPINDWGLPSRVMTILQVKYSLWLLQWSNLFIDG